MTYRVRISDIREYFGRAHEDIIEKLGGAGLIMRKSDFLNVHHLDLLAQGWQEHHKIQIVESNNSWKFLEFADEKHYTMFILKWTI